MQLRAAAAGKRRVDAIADQRVRKQIFVAHGEDEKVVDQHVAAIVGQLREIAHQRERKTLADDALAARNAARSRSG